MKALVIVHLSSLDAYAERAGLGKAKQLADRLKDAILKWKGPVYVIDQRWPLNKWSDPRWNLVQEVQLKRDIQWAHFDDSADDWGIFMRHFRTQLIREGVKEVTLGGVWYYPGGESGCVSEIQDVFRRHFKVKVDEDLVGCWPAAA